MAFCAPGQHPTLVGYKYPPRTGQVYCPEHPAPAGEPDPPVPGQCRLNLARPHNSEVTYWVPIMGRRVCRRHLGILVAEVIRRAEWGTK
jgi:hypothetical protein